MPLGSSVGYQVRFTDRAGDETAVKLMTDGILLAEIQHDRMLRRYDTLILDEAHERSLNIDFLLGYLKQLLPRRPDLKLVITSATIDPERFSRHFDDAPVIEVSGRTFPVETRYRPPADGVDQVQAICDAVDELCLAGPDGDVLVFLSGEREIRDAAEALRKSLADRVEVLPLYARLSSAEQHRVFQPHPGRRVVLATNVAETSLTVPGIRYVVDPGTARISRYSHRTKVQRLPIEPVSRASADQRKGRCGRTSDGICIRLYAEDDFEARPRFTEPEVLRTNLASVILQMTALGLGDVGAFPFVDPPDRRSVADGVALLHELGALDPSEADPGKRLTALGRQLAQLPVDPRLGRMVLAADRQRLRARGAGDHRGTVHPGPAGAPGRATGGRRRRAPPLRRAQLGLPDLPDAVGPPAGTPGRAVLQRLPAAVPGGVPALPAGPRVAGPVRPAAPGGALAGHHGEHRPRRPEDGAPRAAGRPALAHRHAGGHRPARPGVRGGARRALRGVAGLGAGEDRAALGGGGRAGRDVPAVGPDAGPDRAGVGRGARRPPGRADLQRAALVQAAGRGGGHRAGDALRAAHRRRPRRRLRRDRPRAGPRAVHPARAGGGRLGHPAPLLHREPGAACPTWRSSSTAPGAGTSWSTTRRCSTSTTGGCRPRWCRGGTSTQWWKQARRSQPGPARASAASCCSPVPTSTTARHPDRVAAGWAGAAADLPLRARRAGRRGRRSRSRCPG